jgi:hypothetical protein
LCLIMLNQNTHTYIERAWSDTCKFIYRLHRYFYEWNSWNSKAKDVMVTTEN